MDLTHLEGKQPLYVSVRTCNKLPCKVFLVLTGVADMHDIFGQEADDK